MSNDEALEVVRESRCPKAGDGRSCDIRATADIKVAVEVRGGPGGVVARSEPQEETCRSVDDTLKQPEFYDAFEWWSVRCEAHGWNPGP